MQNGSHTIPSYVANPSSHAFAAASAAAFVVALGA
jgi:hypothetical protein